MKKFSNFLIGIKYNFYEDVKKEVQNIIKEKIENAKKENGNKGTEIIKIVVSSALYLTVGSYRLNIDYKKTVDLSKNLFDFKYIGLKKIFGTLNQKIAKMIKYYQNLYVL